MKRLLLLSFFISQTQLSWSADFLMRAGQPATIAVDGCAQAEIGVVEMNPKINGVHSLSTRCLPVFCAYRNESAVAFWRDTKWTIKLMLRDPSKDSTGIIKGQPQFDRRYDKILHKGIETEVERDQIISRYLRNGTCKGVHYDKYIPSV